MGCVSASDDINATDSVAVANDDTVGYDLTGDFIELQELIDDASPGDNITLTKNYVGSGEMQIDKALTIYGNGHYIDASDMSRIFWVREDDVILAGLTFKNGNVVNLDDDTVGGAIYASGALGIINCEFINNKAEYGGAIYANKELIIYYTNFTENEATDGGGAIYAEENTTILYQCEFSENTANYGGAIVSSRGAVLNVANSKFTDNSAEEYGGAIFATNDFKSINNIYTSANANMEFIDYYDDNDETDGTLYLENNTMTSSYPWKIWFEGDTPISSTVILVFVNATAENGDSVTIAAFADDSGNTIRADDINYEIYDSANTLAASGELYYNSEKYGYIYDVALANGTYTITGSPSAEIAGDCRVLSGKLTVGKTKSDRINAPDLTKYFGNSQPLTITVTDGNGNPVKDAEVSITLNGRPYKRTTDSSGTATMNINLGAGEYDAVIEYDGEKTISKITILSTIKGSDVTKMFRNATQYYVECRDSNGVLMKNAAIEFNINGVFYTRYSDDNGMTRMNINLSPGEYIITGRNPQTNQQSSNTIKVLPTVVENHDLTKYFKNASQYYVRLLDAQGNPVGANVSVEFNINGVFYTRFSDASGYVKMNINLAPGDYIITANYNGFLTSNNIHVLNILFGEDVNMDYQDGSKYEVKLLDGQGNPYPNQNVSLNINGVLYQRTTDSQGIARLNINLRPGTYIITAMYNGLGRANTINIKALINTYDCGNGHKLSVPSDVNVEEGQNQDLALRGFFITYSDGQAELDVQYDYSNYDSSAVNEALNYYISYGARSQGSYRGWAILNMGSLTSDGFPQYTLWYADGYLYSIYCDDLNLGKRVVESFS